MAQDPRREWLDDAITRWEKPLLRLCFAFLGDTALAEDAVQETFFKACSEALLYVKVRFLTSAISTCDPPLLQIIQE